MKKICFTSLLFLSLLSQLLGQNIVYAPLNDDNSFNRVLTLRPVGSTVGTADVSPSGAGTYSIPITVPPGTNGVKPSVAINYSSQSGNGPLGLGWRISGLSIITRQPQTVYHDGEVKPVELSSSDRFSIDGAKLLFKAGSLNQNYGGDGNWHGIENENFINVITHGVAGSGPQWIESQSLDGSIAEYGNTTNSRITGSTGAVLAWGINKIIYKDGNYIEFVYTNALGELLISEIKYTGNSVTGLLPYNKIKFDYKTGRIDHNNQYEYGNTLGLNQLLDKITITAELETSKSFQFTYGNDGINTFLTSITESGSGGTALNPTIFKYGNLPLEFSPSSSPIIQNVEGDEYVGDFNSDGFSDLMSTKKTVVNNITYHTEFTIYAKNPANPADHLFAAAGHKVLPANTTLIQKKYSPESSNFLAYDFNGDGADDVLTAKTSILDGKWRLENIIIYTSNRDPSPVSYPIRFDEVSLGTFGAAREINVTTGNYIFAGDFNGDGIQDVLVLTKYPDGNYGADLNLAVVSGGPFSKTTSTETFAIPIADWASAPQIHVLDFNGDGKSDLMVVKGSTCEIFTFDKGATGEPVARRILYTNTLMNDQAKILLGDFNGDSKTDMLIKTPSGWKKVVSKGQGIDSQNFIFDHTPSIIGNQSDDHMTVSDFNGDGKADIYHGWRVNTTTSNLDVYYSQGNGFKFVRNAFSGTLGNTFAIPADLNGDGRSDIINRKSYNQPFDIFYFKKGGKENLLEKVANGVGHTTEWNYKNLTEAGTFYYQGDLSAFPINNIQPAMYTVSEFKGQNGLGGNTISQYKYGQAKLHRTGKGFLGFTTTTRLDQAMGTNTVTEALLNDTYVELMPYKIKSLLSTDSSLLNQITFAYDFIDITGIASNHRRFWIRPSSTTENNAIAGNTTVTSYGYESSIPGPKSHGYPSSVSVNNNNIETTVTHTVTDVIYGTPNLYKTGTVTVSKTRSGQPVYSAKTKFGYNSLGQVTSKKVFEGLAKEMTTDYVYGNNLGNITSEKLSTAGMTSRTTSYEYDLKGRYIESTTNAMEQSSSKTYDPKWGSVLVSKSVDSLTTTLTYDEFGRIATTTVPGSYTINDVLSWDISGKQVWKKTITYSQPGRSGASIWFDLLGREIKKETADFSSGLIATTTSYDARGNISSIDHPRRASEPSVLTVNDYDAYNRLSSIDDTNRGSTTISYSQTGGNTTVTRTTASGTTSQTSDASGLVISATDEGGTLEYTYFSHGGLKSVVKNGAILTSNEYDEYGRQTKLIDANAGTTTFDYNAFGELREETNGNGITHTMLYNSIGNVISRSAPQELTTYEYGTSNSNGESKGKIKKITGFTPNNRFQQTYDNLGRVHKVTETTDGIDHVTTYGYNVYGDVNSVTYPSGLVITKEYDNNGYLQNLKSGGSIIYSTTTINGQGQVTNYTKGNGKSSSIEYVKGFPTKYETQASTPTSFIQKLSMGWDYPKGILTSRTDARGTLKTETFSYDGLNRLTGSTFSGITNGTTYLPNGNIETKTDAGSYSYHPVKSNAVIGVTNPIPSPIPSTQQDITYNSFMQPDKVIENNYVLEFTYGSDYERIKSTLKNGPTEVYTRQYFSNGYEKDNGSGISRELHFINSPVGLAAIIIKQNGTYTTHYTYTDHLGSILTVTDASGNISATAEQSFDSWGRRRDPVTWELLPANTGLPPVWLYRGYTGHEHLDQFGLINMNARMYDPVLGRMLSPDLLVQESGITQSFNRYSYAMNNPLVNTDPDGRFWNFVIGGVIGGFSGWQIGKANGAKGWNMAGSILMGTGMGVITAGIGTAVSGAAVAWGTVGSGIASGVASGFTAGSLNGVMMQGNILKSGIKGGLIGGAIGGAMGVFNAAVTANKNIGNYTVDGPVLSDNPVEFSKDSFLKFISDNGLNPDEVNTRMYISSEMTPEGLRMGDDIKFWGRIGEGGALPKDYNIAGTVRRGDFWQQLFSSKTNTFIAEGAFQNAKLLYTTTAHEFIHAHHVAIGFNIHDDEVLHALSEQSAYDWSMRASRALNFNGGENYYKSIIQNFAKNYKQGQSSLSLGRFHWKYVPGIMKSF
jgi:RHS repeat-associated protein